MTPRSAALLTCASALLALPGAARPEAPDYVVSKTGPAYERLAFELLERPEPAPSAPVERLLRRHYPKLPRALLAPAVGIPGGASDSKGSFSSPGVDGQPCLIHLSLDARGRSGIARDIQDLRRDLAGDPQPLPQALADDLEELEALHEFGHCAQYAAAAKFSHPALTPEQNAALSALLPADPDLGTLDAELYADAYSALLFLASREGPARPLATSELRLASLWRAATAELNAKAADPSLPPTAPSNPLPPLRLQDHATAPVIDEILSRPEHYLAMDPALGAAEASAKALARIAARSAESAESARTAFDPALLAKASLADAMDDLWGRQRDLAAQGAGPAEILSDSKRYFEEGALAGGPAGAPLAAYARRAALASIQGRPAWAMLPDSDARRPPEHSPEAMRAAFEASKALGELAAADPAYLAALAKGGAPPAVFAAARQGWALALDAEKASFPWAPGLPNTAPRPGLRDLAPFQDPGALRAFLSAPPPGEPR